MGTLYIWKINLLLDRLFDFRIVTIQKFLTQKLNKYQITAKIQTVDLIFHLKLYKDINWQKTYHSTSQAFFKTVSCNTVTKSSTHIIPTLY